MLSDDIVNQENEGVPSDVVEENSENKMKSMPLTKLHLKVI